MKHKDETGDNTIIQNEWKMAERMERKEEKNKSWYKRGGYESVIFVPCTQDSELLKKLQKNIDKSSLKIKLIEKAGSTLGDLLRTSDPRKEQKCDRDDCPIFTKGGRGNCRALNVNYRMTCECDGKYTGTTTRSGYVCKR